MLFQSQIYASFVLVLFSFAVHEISALNYASVKSADGGFMLQWTYNNSMLMFKMRCKTKGWCGVGFTTTGNGRGMVNYDIAVGGVDGMQEYLNDYQSVNTNAPPPEDTTPDYMLIKASEDNGYTNVEFYRNATTGDMSDVQFTNDTEVWIVWAWHSSNDAASSLSKHTSTGVSSNKHNLIAEAMSATMVQPSATTPTTKNAGSDVGSRVVIYAILAFIACVLHF